MIVVHLGEYKTGTTSLQAALYTSESRAFVYPSFGLSLGSGQTNPDAYGHHRLAQTLKKVSPGKDVLALANSYARDVSGLSEHRMVFSSELFLDSPENVLAFFSLLAHRLERELIFVLALRNPYEYIDSMSRQSSWKLLPTSQEVAVPFSKSPRFCQACQDQDTTVFIHPQGGKAFEEFVREVGSQICGEQLTSIPHANASWSFESISIARGLRVSQRIRRRRGRSNGFSRRSTLTRLAQLQEALPTATNFTVVGSQLLGAPPSNESVMEWYSTGGTVMRAAANELDFSWTSGKKVFDHREAAETFKSLREHPEVERFAYFLKAE